MFYFQTVNNCSRHALSGFIILLTGLFSGCASEPPLLFPPETTQSHTYRDIAAYNKPYKVKGQTYYPIASGRGYSERGIASWYGYESGNRTAMGTPFKPQGLTAAHKTLPLPSKVRVTNLLNGRSVVVLVNDRGPFRKNRLIDLSQGAAKQIGIRGLANVKVEFLENQPSSDDYNNLSPDTASSTE
ncbi:MAG: septal ring lytic transglycosylase RlpA family protein [Methylobacter sp.]|nr:septal ring lytic transglycosylase RlpA family protein [Methylobacter sp.]